MLVVRLREMQWNWLISMTARRLSFYFRIIFHVKKTMKRWRMVKFYGLKLNRNSIFEPKMSQSILILNSIFWHIFNHKIWFLAHNSNKKINFLAKNFITNHFLDYERSSSVYVIKTTWLFDALSEYKLPDPTNYRISKTPRKLFKSSRV